VTEIQVQNYCTQYKDHLETQLENDQLKHSTKEGKRYAVDEFVAYFDYEDKVLDTEDYYQSTDNIKEFFDQTAITGGKVAAIRTFLEYIQKDLSTREAERLDDVKDRIKKAKLVDSNGKGKSKKKRLEEKILTDEEQEVVFSVADDFEELILQCMLDTGCRPGELAALTMSDFDFDRNEDGIGATVKIEKTYSQGVGVQDSPKTEDSYRTVNLRPDTAEMLKEFVDDNDIMEDQLIFRDYRTVYDSIKDVFTFAHVKMRGEGVTKFSPHSLRHNTATRLIREGVSKEKVQRYMGHSSIDVTEIYEHFNEDEVINVYA